MRRLMLLRHAKADPHHHGGPGDRDRALTARGRDDCARIGRHLGEPSLAIGFAIVSDAARTRETFQFAVTDFGQSPPSRLEPGLYDEDWTVFLDLVRGVPDDAASLLLVGHNPDLATFARRLAGAGAPVDLAALRRGFPTGALAVIDFDAERWADIGLGQGRLDRLTTPAQLGGGGDD